LRKQVLAAAIRSGYQEFFSNDENARYDFAARAANMRKFVQSVKSVINTAKAGFE